LNHRIEAFGRCIRDSVLDVIQDSGFMATLHFRNGFDRLKLAAQCARTPRLKVALLGLGKYCMPRVRKNSLLAPTRGWFLDSTHEFAGIGVRKGVA